MHYKPYYAQGWQSGREGATPITPEALNHIEEGIEQIYSDFAPAVESQEHTGCYYRTVNEVVEWINPPMVPGVEYRTIKRYKAKPVYTKFVECGTMPNKTFKRTTFSNELVEVHSIKGIAANSNISEKEKNIFPVVFSGNIVAYAYIQHLNGKTALDVTTTQDLSNYTATFVLKYTKQTD